MAARWIFVKSLIREAIEKPDFTLVDNIDTAYAKLRAVQRGAYTLVTAASGLVQVSSTMGDTTFSFTIPEGFSPADLVEAVETALALIEGKTVADAKALLIRRKNTQADFSGFRL